MTTDTLSAALDYYARIGASLFPIPAGQKNPTGIVSSWKKDHSSDPATWQRWYAEHRCNFGLVASASRLIIVDVDVSEVGRERAWQLWTQWCADHSIAVPPLNCQSARGGWHYYFRLPDDVDPATLTQPALIGPQPGFKKSVVDTRVEGFTVAAGSYYDGTAKGEQSGHYILAGDVPPTPAPPALISFLTRQTAPPASAASLGTRDAGDVAAMLRWMAEREAFASYEDWLTAGMALRVEFGDAGFDLWLLTTWPDAHDAAAGKWSSFATDASSASVTLNSLLSRAHALGWRGTVRKSTSAMFDTVAAIAATAGAQLSGNQPMPMVAGQQVLTDIGAPILTEFLTATADAPSRPANPDFPTLPDTCSGHGLFQPLQDCIARTVAMAESPKTWKAARIVQAAAVLSLVHADTQQLLGRRVEMMGCPWPWSRIKLAATAIADKVERAFVDQGDWVYDDRGNIESDNSDNVAVFLGILGCELRWNAWLERAEIRGYEWGDWTTVDDTIVAVLRTRGNRTKTRFRPTKEFFWDSMLALARTNTVDPALQRLDALADTWDRVPRLSIWLARACGTACDLYHQAVSRNIVGGMVRRIREPGCKHDTMPIFFGYQGSGKSTVAAIIADMGQSSLADLVRGGGKWFTDTVQLGDEAKELVLSLGGVCVAEIAEMGMRNSANANHVKAMISRQVDRGRTAYARSVSERPRRNLFFGTTNENEPLTDPTGNRRFLPIRVDSEIDLKWLRDNIEQIVGEAAFRHAAGESFEIPRSIWTVAAEHQEAARSASDLEIQLHAWFGVTSFTTTAFVTADDLLRACTKASLRASPAARAAVMKQLDFRPDKPYLNGKRTRVWYRGPKGAMPTNSVRYIVGSTPTGDVRVGISSS